VTPASSSAEPHGQYRQDEGFQVPHSRDEREQPEDECDENQECGGCDPRAPSGQCAPCQRTGADGPGEATGGGANRFLGVGQDETESDTPGNRGRERDREAKPGSGKQGCGKHPDAGSKADEDPDRVEISHPASSVRARFEPAACEERVVRMSGSDPGRSREPQKPLLVFFSAKRSGPARRMDSLLDHLARKERGRLRVLSVDVEEDPATARRFRVRKVPTLVLVKDKRTVARVEGRAKATDIEGLVEPYLPADRQSESARSQ
jgi:thioredoxin 1